MALLYDEAVAIARRIRAIDAEFEQWKVNVPADQWKNFGPTSELEGLCAPIVQALAETGWLSSFHECPKDSTPILLPLEPERQED